MIRHMEKEKFAEPSDSVGHTLWITLGGRRLENWWDDLRHDPLATPIRSLPRESKTALGQLGEDLAARYLREIRSMRLLWRNFRAHGGGEVDLIAGEGDTLVFVEVKTRTSLVFGRPLDAVDTAKQQLIARGALDWLRQLGRPGIAFRFDVAEVLLTEGKIPQINWLVHAFELPEPYYLPH